MAEDSEVGAHEKRENDRLFRIAGSHCAQLAEHFSTVQIICTHETPEGTALTVFGQGNWYARKESCREFLKQK